MTIDVSKLKAGDVVLLELKVTKNDARNKHICFSRDLRPYHDFIFSYKQVSEAIKEILPAPFDWKDVKPGMAFYPVGGKTMYYSGPDPLEKNYVICASADCVCSIRKDNLTRAQEYDIEVPE